MFNSLSVSVIKFWRSLWLANYIKWCACQRTRQYCIWSNQCIWL